MRRIIRILSLLLARSFICTTASLHAKPSGKVVLASKSQPDTLDPTIASGRVDQWSNHALFDGLLHRNPETLSIEPWLATSIKNINSTTWELNLKEGVKFHNGERFDAEAVKFSVERSLDPKMKSPIIKNIDWVKEVQVLSPYKGTCEPRDVGGPSRSRTGSGRCLAPQRSQPRSQGRTLNVSPERCSSAIDTANTG